MKKPYEAECEDFEWHHHDEAGTVAVEMMLEHDTETRAFADGVHEKEDSGRNISISTLANGVLFKVRT